MASVLAFALSIGLAAPANAGWLTSLIREAGEAGLDGAGSAAGRLARTGLPGLDDGVAVLRKMPDSADAVRLAAHVTPEGHWSFANRNGDVFTAADESEMARVVSALAPDAADGGKAQNLALHLDQESVFTHRARLDALPAHARLYVTAEGKALEIVRRGEGPGSPLAAKVRSNVEVPLTGRAAFAETIWQLSRRLNRADIRVVALDTGGADTLRTTPLINKAAGRAEVDRIKPDRLMEALREVRGQTVVIKGRIEDGAFVATPVGGSARRFDLVELSAAAARHDVNLVVLRSNAPRQPGGRNWLWQRVEIDGLTEAMQRPTYADFLNALGERRGVLSVDVRPQGEGRVILQAEPVRSGAGSGSAAPFGDVVGDIGNWVGHVASEVTGTVVTDAVTASLNSKERQEELDWRIVPFIPSLYQILYLAGIVCGIAGWGVARAWWRSVWKKETRDEYGSAFGYYAARVVKALAFVFVFLPVAGIPAFIASIALQVWGWITLPFRAIGWVWGKMTARA